MSNAGNRHMIEDHDYSHSLPLPVFDRELGFEDLLSGIDRKKLVRTVSDLLGEPVRLVSPGGQLALGEVLEQVGKRLPIRTELEAIAYLELGSEGNEKAQSGVQFIEMLLRSTARYLMASDLHLEAVKSDYDELQKKHAELTLSEQKYRELSEHLEQRVVEQVSTIEEAHRNLYETEKMASVGQLAAGVAHEINNPMAFIYSNLLASKDYVGTISDFSKKMKLGISLADLEKAWAEEDMDFVIEDFQSLLEESVSGAKRVTSIIKDLKDFSNVDHSDEEYADINAIIRSACNVTHGHMGDEIEIDLKLNSIPETKCRPGYLGQVWLSILRNAESAIKGSGKISIETSSAGERIFVSIRDTGVGMSPEILKRAFEPFFTTREVGKGTGLGLTVTRDIINSHDGGIEIESKEGEGTTVTLWLPVKSIESEMK